MVILADHISNLDDISVTERGHFSSGPILKSIVLKQLCIVSKTGG